MLKTIIMMIACALATSAMASDKCIAHRDLQEIARDFSQFKKFLGNQNEYCQGDMDQQWYQIAQSLVTLKNVKANEPDLDNADAMTYRAISESDWWAYFTKRADKFNIRTNCQEGVIAYVMPLFGSGTINLCLRFFDMNISSQASVMMHEVRHFDGHRHVTCTQGNEEGTSGACDRKISSKGSYAISVQTLVGLARAEDTPNEDKALLQSEALYMAYNKFNEVPEVKVNYGMLLGNDAGDVYRWTEQDGLNHMTTLKSPAILNASGDYITLYPIDRNEDAYRMDAKLKTSVENPGLFAKTYNEDKTERDLYKSISYQSESGMLKGNKLLTLCNSKTLEIGKKDLSTTGNFLSMITLSHNAKSIGHDTFLVAATGELYSFECKSRNTSAVLVEKSPWTLDSSLTNLRQTVTLGSQHFAIDDQGNLIKIFSRRQTLTQDRSYAFPHSDHNWITVAPSHQAEVF